ncbi:MAG TPA: hypothetical protein DEQ40_12925 [Oxalobacteraceae bacterium]|jgi:hypothetical protein|nr:hypothetical protein [Oxalobacteraceae bacterium]
MLAILDTSCATSILPFEPPRVQNQEGDWNEYLYQSAFRRNPEHPCKHAHGLLDYKRDCALAYLGKRAQLYGGVCSKTKPRILTPQMLADLEASNRTRRHSQYPWMERLMSLMSEIERSQEQIEVAASTRMISLVTT